MYDIEKNKKRSKEFPLMGIQNLHKPLRVAKMLFTYAGEDMAATFIEYKHEFLELYNGKMRKRKGLIGCSISPLSDLGYILAVGWSVCSEKDEWDTGKGCLVAFTDAINYISYMDKKECIDGVWKSILNKAESQMKII